MIDLRHKSTGEIIVSIDLPMLAKADLSGLDLAGVNLRDASLWGTNLSNADLENADLTGARLPYTDLRGANLNRAHFWHADIHQALLTDADLSGADFNHTQLFASELTGANLRDLRLCASRVTWANLSGRSLPTQKWFSTQFTKVELQHSDLSHSLFKRLIFDQCDLSGMCLAGSSLVDVIFRRVNLAGTDFTDCELGDGSFIDCPTLHLAVGLETVLHKAPRPRLSRRSCIDIDTLRASVTQLPGRFLNGMGLSTGEIECLRAMFRRTGGETYVAHR